MATTFPQLVSPFAPASASGSVDVEIADAAEEHAPSTRDLLERAARLGPPRPTFASIVLPNDPILAEKMQPHAAQRRAKLTKVVKATLGACLAVCVAALVATALSGGEASAASSEAAEIGARTAPATRIVSIEKLDDARRAKAAKARVTTTTASTRVSKKKAKRR